MMQRIHKREFNGNLDNGYARIQCFPGATPKYLHHHVLPFLIEDKPQTLVIHGGTNSIRDHDQTPDKIANQVIDIGKTARSLGVDNIVITGLITRRNGIEIERKRRAVNTELSKKCFIHNFIFVNNDNIVLEDIFDDRVHLEESGSIKLANNILRTFNTNQQLL